MCYSRAPKTIKQPYHTFLKKKKKNIPKKKAFSKLNMKATKTTKEGGQKRKLGSNKMGPKTYYQKKERNPCSSVGSTLVRTAVLGFSAFSCTKRNKNKACFMLWRFSKQNLGFSYKHYLFAMDHFDLIKRVCWSPRFKHAECKYCGHSDSECFAARPAYQPDVL